MKKKSKKSKNNKKIKVLKKMKKNEKKNEKKIIKLYIISRFATHAYPIVFKFNKSRRSLLNIEIVNPSSRPETKAFF